MFYDDVAGFLLPYCQPAFFFAEFYVKWPAEGRLVKNFESRIGQKAHFYDLVGHLQLLIVIANDFSAFFSREAAELIGGCAFHNRNLDCKYSYLKLI